MSEVVLPPIETEPEVPGVVIPEVEKPTALSKVISVNFNPLNTKVTTSIDTHEGFATTDTDAWVIINILDMTEPTGKYSLVLHNREDGSVFQRVGDIVKGVAYYKLIPDEIKHAGRWVGQVVVTLENGQTTTSRFNFMVSGHLLDGKDVREIVIQDFQTLMKQLNDLKNNAGVDIEVLKNSVEETNRLANENELLREEAESIREDAENARVVSYDTKVDAAIVATDVNSKVGAKVAELSPTIQNVTAQLAQTQKEFSNAVGAVTEDSEVVLARTSSVSDLTYNLVGERIDDLEKFTYGEAKMPIVDYTSASGSKFLQAGTRENGFYGFVSAQEMGELLDNPVGKRNFDGANLALAIGLASGTAFNIDTPWMKFSRRGEIYFVPVKPIRHSAAWNAIYNQGAVYGDETVGVVPPNGRAGKRLSISAENNAFLIGKDSEGYGFLRAGTDIAKVGDTIVTKGFANAENNGEFVVQSISDTAIVVDKVLKEEGSAPKGVIYEKTKAVKQDRVVKVGSNRFRVQLLKGAAQDPLNSYLDADRDLTGPESEWNALILPMHEKARLQNWTYKDFAGTTEDWGIGLTDADLLTQSQYGYGSYTWCQETSDESSYRRVLRGNIGASYGSHNISWTAGSSYGFRPALHLLS